MPDPITASKTVESSVASNVLTIDVEEVYHKVLWIKDMTGKEKFALNDLFDKKGVQSPYTSCLLFISNDGS